MLARKLNDLKKSFLFSQAAILDVATNFKAEMLNGLTGTSSLKMLPTFLKIPLGKEKGQYLAIDFGGTNIRLQLVELLGKGSFQNKETISFRLKDLEAGHDLTTKQTSATEMFDFIVTNLMTLIKKDKPYALGHTFSFPCRQISVDRAILLHWTKEIKTTGVEGQEITDLLEKALVRHQLYQINPVAILNDTTAILLTASYSDHRADIGSICGTGHNTCYREPLEPITKKPMIINMESGNFNRFPRTIYDLVLDQASEKPGQQYLEKAVSGHYVGEIARHIIFDLIEQELLFRGQNSPVPTPYSVKAQHLALFLQDQTPELQNISQWLAHTWQIQHSSREERAVLQTIASLVTTRSAQLIAATYAGILLHVDPQLQNEHVIGVDGSMFEKMPNYNDTILGVFQDLYRSNAKHVVLRLIKDGSSVGAAIASAISALNLHSR